MKSIYYYMLAGLTLSTSGCSSWLSEDDAPVMSYDYYETEAGVNAAITAAYGFLRWGVGGERFNVLTELGTDLFTEGEDGSNRESYNKYATQLNPDDGILYEMWENHYKGISDANIAMQKILDSQDLLESVKTQSYAEMQFIRAYLYFDLVQQFGRIPLVTEGSFEIRTDFKRAPVADIYNVIISDLRNAAENTGEGFSFGTCHTVFSCPSVSEGLSDSWQCGQGRAWSESDGYGQYALLCRASDQQWGLLSARKLLLSVGYQESGELRSCVCRAVHNRADV